MTNGVHVGSTGDVPRGEGRAIVRSTTGTTDDIAILHDTDGQFWALDNTCTHQVASLAEGWVEDGYVECPLHASRFDLRTGAVSGLPATRPVACHRLEVRGDELWLFPGEAPRLD